MRWAGLTKAQLYKLPTGALFCEPHLYLDFGNGFSMALHKTAALYRVKELFSNPIQDVIHGAYGDMDEDFEVGMVINIK